MSASNGVIRIGRKGVKKFAFGEEGQPGSEPFEVDVVVAFQDWISIDESFRQSDGLNKGEVLLEDMPAYNQAAVDFAKKWSKNETLNTTLNAAEAKDFLARLREAYDEVADFFRPKSPEKPDSRATSGVELRFSAEPEGQGSPTSMN